MSKRVIISLFAMSMAVLMWSEAHAGCRVFGGTLICASWIPGSEICKANTSTKLCGEKGENCRVTCFASGPKSPKSGGIPGFAFCQAGKAGGSHDDDKRDEIIVKATLEDTLMETGGKTKCKKGRCRTKIKLDPDNCDDLCNEPGYPHCRTFTATKFTGEVEVCLYGKKHLKCKSIVESCTINPKIIESGKSGQYRCERLH